MTTETLEQKKSAIPELSPDVRVLADRLGRLQPDETVSYTDLSALIARDVQGSARYVLQSARRIAEREYGIALAPVMGEGIKRLADGHVADLGDSAMASIRRKARRTSRRMLNVAAKGTLDQGQATRVAARASILGAISLCAGQARIKQVESVVQLEPGKQLPVGRTLDLFKK